ncbi:MAG: hypothetical protein ABH867_00210 [Patescibacteria group bacterium]|nr:hypothetical protein [Patescibacteria group bacterium]
MGKYGFIIAGLLILTISGVGLVQLLRSSNLDKKRGEQFIELNGREETEPMAGESGKVKLEVLETQVENGDQATVSDPATANSVMTDEEMDKLDSEIDGFSSDLDFEEEPEVEFEID